MNPKQYNALIDAVYATSCNVWLIGLLISVQLSGWDSWESIWLTVGVGLGLIATFVRHMGR